MPDEQKEVSICQVTISCPGIPYYRSVKILPAASTSDQEALIKNELKALFRENNLGASEKAFDVKIEEQSRKVIDPMFELVRFCTYCGLTAADAGVENDSFVHCGRCGKPTAFLIQDPE